MTTSEPQPPRFTPEPEREDTPRFPTRFGHERRRPQPPAGRADREDDARGEDPFEDDGGL